jgi:hypothetical protein
MAELEEAVDVNERAELENGVEAWLELVADEEAVDEAAYCTLVLDELDDTVLNDETVVLDCTSDVADERKLDDPADEEEPTKEKGGKLEIPVVEDENADDTLRIPATEDEGLVTLEEVEELLESAMIDEEVPVIPEDAGVALELPTSRKSSLPQEKTRRSSMIRWRGKLQMTNPEQWRWILHSWLSPKMIGKTWNLPQLKAKSSERLSWITESSKLLRLSMQS